MNCGITVNKKGRRESLSKKHLRLDLIFNFYNGMLIGGGKGGDLIDSFVLKDYDNKPYIPASTIKGRVRYNYTMLLNTFSDNESFHSLNAGKEVCKLFGGEGNSPGILYFEDLKLDKNSIKDKYLYDTRVGILINRYNRQVKDDAFFQYEISAIDEKQKFVGSIEGYMDEKDYKKQVVLLYTAIKMIQTLGGNQSRGVGWLGDNSAVKVFLDNKFIDENTLENWGENIEI